MAGSRALVYSFSARGRTGILGLFGSPWSQIFGVTDEAVAGAINASISLIGSLLGIYLMAWGVAWAVGNVPIGPLRSIRIMQGTFQRTVVLMIAGALPLMALHYAPREVAGQLHDSWPELRNWIRQSSLNGFGEIAGGID